MPTKQGRIQLRKLNNQAYQQGDISPEYHERISSVMKWAPVVLEDTVEEPPVVLEAPVEEYEPRMVPEATVEEYAPPVVLEAMAVEDAGPATTPPFAEHGIEEWNEEELATVPGELRQTPSQESTKMDTPVSERDATPAEEVKAAGYLFTWCCRCFRKDVAIYGEGVLPREITAKGSMTAGIVATCCRECHGQSDHVPVNVDPRSRGFRLTQHQDHQTIEQNFQQLQLGGALWKQLDISKAAETVSGRLIAGLVDEQGAVQFVDANTIIRTLGKGDRMASVGSGEQGEATEGKKLLAFLEGGFI